MKSCPVHPQPINQSNQQQEQPSNDCLRQRECRAAAVSKQVPDITGFSGIEYARYSTQTSVPNQEHARTFGNAGCGGVAPIANDSIDEKRLSLS
jgi:hypothetical protein